MKHEFLLRLLLIAACLLLMGAVYLICTGRLTSAVILVFGAVCCFGAVRFYRGGQQRRHMDDK